MIGITGASGEAPGTDSSVSCIADSAPANPIDAEPHQAPVATT